MLAMSATAVAVSALALLAAAAFALALLRVRVKLRSASRRWLGVRVYDFGADLKLPPTVGNRSYQVALYFTMKSLPREPAKGPVSSPSVNAPVASR